jgi:hypothetical protein
MASLLSAKNNGAKAQLAAPSKVAHSTLAVIKITVFAIY